MREKILTGTEELTCKYGVKRITMDDIARELGISKKTIYLHFKDKNELVYVLMETILERQKSVMDNSTAGAKDAVEEIFRMVTIMQEMLSKMNPMMFYDLQKYHPAVWQLFKVFRYDYMKTCLLKNLNRGMQEGLFRKDLNLEIIALLRLEQVDMIFNHTVYPAGRFMLSEVMTKITEHYLYGLCTLKGHKLINEYIHVTEE